MQNSCWQPHLWPQEEVIALNRKYENRRFSNVREGCFDRRGRKIKEMQYLKT